MCGAADTSSSVTVIGREALQELARQGEIKVQEEKRIKEAAMRLEHDIILRQVEHDTKEELERRVKECIAFAKDRGYMHNSAHFELKRPVQQEYVYNLRAKQFERMREVLTRELPLRLPGVDFEIIDHKDHNGCCEFKAVSVWLDWRVIEEVVAGVENGSCDEI